MFEGDVNLSCTMTFLSSLGSFAFTTLWVWLLGTPLVGRAVTIPYLQLTVSLASFTVELNCVLNVKALVGNFTQEKALLRDLLRKLRTFVWTLVSSSIPGAAAARGRHQVQVGQAGGESQEALQTFLPRAADSVPLCRPLGQQVRLPGPWCQETTSRYLHSRHFFYLATWRLLVAGAALGFMGYTFGALLAALCRQTRPQASTGHTSILYL